MSKKTRICLIVGIAFVVAAFFAWQLKPVSHLATATEQREFDLQVSYDKFRQIMVRKNATKAIVGHGGMKIISEVVNDLQVDLSADDRPILNAIRGKSKAEVNATKMLTVELNNSQIDAEQLTLRQQSHVDADGLRAESTSIGEQGQIKKYVTILSASPQGDVTHVTLQLEMQIQIDVPKLFTQRADSEVSKAAVETLAQQQEAITAFVIEHADERIVLPELN